MGGIFSARVFVTLKPMVNDPQGLAVRNSLKNLGFSLVRDVRVGKLVELVVEATGEEEARRQVEEMCRRLLANPIIERYSYEIGSSGQDDASSNETD